MLRNRRPPGSAPVPAPQLGADLDRQLVAELRRVGADLTEPRDTRFYLYFGVLDDAEAAAAALEDDGYETDVAEYGDGADAWRLVAWRELVVDDESIVAVRKRLGTVAVQHWGRLGGWEAAVTF